MPNTKVSLTSGFIGGIVAGTVFQIVQWGYINFQIGVAKFNAIYGSFAALPLFLVWLQLSWLIVLLGAEISFAHQNVDTYEFEPDCLKASIAFKKLFSLHMVQMIVKNFGQKGKPLTDVEISHQTEGPIRLVRQLLFELVVCGVLSEVNVHDDKKVAYQPGRDTDSLTIKSVIDAMEKRGSDRIPLAESKDMEKLITDLKSFDEAIQKAPTNVLVKNI